MIKNYKTNKRITCVHAYVKTDKHNIDKILSKNKIDKLDLISIDIDGLDYEIMKSLKIRPKIICVEVNAGHGGKKSKLIPINLAKDNIGQPLTIFTKLAREMGYKLVAYTGNAFFVYSPDVKTAKLKPASPTEAYRDFLQHLMDIEKEWLMLVNLGIETPYYPYLSKELFFWNLGIPFRKTTKLIIHRIYLKYKSIK